MRFNTLQKKSRLVRKIIVLICVFFIVGCQNTLNESQKSPEFPYILEHAFYPEDDTFALVVSPEPYSERLGLELSQIVVFTSNSDELSQESSTFLNFPWNLQWFDKDHLFFLQKDSNTKKTKFVNWDIGSDQQIDSLFPYSGFSTSNDSEKLVAWGALGQRSDGTIYEIYNGQIEFYTVPSLEYLNEEVFLFDNQVKIYHVEWSDDDQELLILGQLANESRLFISHLNLETGDQEKILTGIPRTNKFSWNSSRNLLAFTNHSSPHTLQVYDILRKCFILNHSQRGKSYANPVLYEDYLTVTVNEKNSGYQLMDIPFSDFENNACIE